VRLFTELFRALRPRQWTKNLFVFAGLVFSQHLLDKVQVLQVLGAFAVFCMASGCIYLFNDLVDLQNDRLHPLKRLRPLASGRLSPGVARWALAVLLVLTLGLGYLLGLPFLMVILVYLGVQILYSLFLKRIVILDVFCVAIGFVLRVLAGALVIQVEVSRWLVVCTLMVSLFLGLAKRRHELTLAGEEATSHREVLAEYSVGLLDQLISVATAATVLSYTLYTVDPETVAKFSTGNLVFTVPFVLYGVFRYLYLIHMKGAGAGGAGGSPENTLLNDPPLLVNISLWGLTVILVLYSC
jgi:4-hydroxybenzoate polyprenyltransferase